MKQQKVNWTMLLKYLGTDDIDPEKTQSPTKNWVLFRTIHLYSYSTVRFLSPTLRNGSQVISIYL